MKVVTTNLLNRFWKNGVKPIKDALTNKVDSSKIVNSLLTTAAGFALDARQGKVLDDKITELNRNSEWRKVGEYTGTASTTITLNESDYRELLLCIGASANSNVYYRVMQSTLIPIYAYTNTASSDGNGAHQVVYNDTYSGGLTRVSATQAKLYCKNASARTVLYAR